MLILEYELDLIVLEFYFSIIKLNYMGIVTVFLKWQNGLII